MLCNSPMLAHTLRALLRDWGQMPLCWDDPLVACSFCRPEISYELMAKSTGSLAQRCRTLFREGVCGVAQAGDCVLQFVVQTEILVAGGLRQKHAAALFAEVPIPKALPN